MDARLAQWVTALKSITEPLSQAANLVEIGESLLLMLGSWLKRPAAGVFQKLRLLRFG